MKKVLATVAALGLVLGVTANAFALDQPGKAAAGEADTAPRVAVPTAPGVALWSVAGQWVLAGAYLSNGFGDPGNANVYTDSSNDDFYVYSFKILPVLQVNDKISLKGEIRFIDRSTFGTSTESLASNRDLDMRHVYMEWMSPFGKTRFGRTPGGGWAGGFMNSVGVANRLMWWPNMLPKNWGSLIFTQKLVERDATLITGDDDSDGYYVDLSYKAGFGKTIAALWATRNGASRDSSGDHHITTQARLYGNYTFDNLGVEYEVNYNFGDSTPEGANTTNADANALGASVGLTYKMQDFTLGGLFFYMSGDSDITDNDKEGMLQGNGTGNDWNPYQIMTGDYMGLLNADNPLTAGGDVNSSIVPGGGISAGVWSIGVNVKYAMSPKLSIGGEIGYFAAAEDIYTNQDDDMGIEFGVGIGYKLMDNLMYNAHFSFLSTGDFFTEGVAAATTEDVYLLAHALSMKF